MQIIYEGTKIRILLKDSNTHIIQCLGCIGIHKEIETQKEDTLNNITNIIEELKNKRNRTNVQFKKRLNQLQKQIDVSDLDKELDEIKKILV